MRAVLCVDVEPDERTPDGASWDGAVQFLRDDTWMRSLLPGAVVNWFLRIDHQVEVLCGDDCWAATHFGDRLLDLVGAGDEAGVHPHTWRLHDGAWTMVGDDDWAVENAQRAIDGYRSVFGHVPPSFRYGDRFVSDAVVRLLRSLPGVAVDLTAEPGVSTARGLVPAERALGLCRHVDPARSNRYRPSVDALDLVAAPDEDGDLTMVPLTTGLVPDSGVIDTMVLWREPEVFARMLRLRLLDDGVDHLAFAIRSDLVLHSWAVEHVTANLLELQRSVPDLEFVRASELPLGLEEAMSPSIGLVGALGREVDRIDSRLTAVDADRAVATAALESATSDLAALRSRLDAATGYAAQAQAAADDLRVELAVVRATATWRLHQRLLPLLRPVVGRVRRWRGVAVDPAPDAAR